MLIEATIYPRVDVPEPLTAYAASVVSLVIVTVGADVHLPPPDAAISTTPLPILVEPTNEFPPPAGVMLGAVGYPDPASVIVNPVTDPVPSTAADITA